jgi:glycosyltransferase involved in cell wall biosynthesis
MPDVSVVIPTRDRYRYLSLTLQSVMRQQGVDLEIIVVDDGSVDETATKLSHPADPRVRLVRNDVPLGESGARNRGIEHASGEWIAFLDDDDLWAPNKLVLQLYAVRRSGAPWVYGGDVLVDDGLRILHAAPPPTPEQVMRQLRTHNSVPAGASNVMVRTGVLSRAGPFDVGLRRTADWDMWLRLARAGSPAFVSKPVVANRVHRTNVSRDMKLLSSELRVIAERHDIRVDRARHFRWAAWTSMLDGQRWQAVRYYARALAAGDLASGGRAAVAVLDRHYASRMVRRSNAAAGRNAWADEGRAWLRVLQSLPSS